MTVNEEYCEWLYSLYEEEGEEYRLQRRDRLRWIAACVAFHVFLLVVIVTA